MKDDFEYKIYDKFTELFVSQKGISDSLSNFTIKVEDLSSSIANLHLSVDKKVKSIEDEVTKTKETIIKQAALISASVKVSVFFLVILSAASWIMFKEVFSGIGEILTKFI